MKLNLIQFQLAAVLGFGVLFIGCTSIPTPPTAVQANTPSGQMLPIAAIAKIRNTTIGLEVAATPEQQEIGLMYRTSLANDRGMLFPFNPPRPTQFWMKNTLIPLDMVFLRNGVVKTIAANTPPCKADPCPVYGSQLQEIDQVIELRGGRAAELGLKVGDRVAVQFIRK